MSDTHNPAMWFTDVLSWHGENLDVAVKNFSETMNDTAEATERVCEILDTFSGIMSDEIDLDLDSEEMEHYQSFVREATTTDEHREGASKVDPTFEF